MKLDRRCFLISSLAAGGASLIHPASSTGQPSIEEAASDPARRAAVHRQRRLIFNDDGDDAWAGNPDLPPIEGFLDCRLNHLDDCGIDSVFYCTTQSINSFTHNSQLTEVFTSKSGQFANNRMSALIELGTDPLQLAIDACRQKNQEVFWTLRMNDWHDNFNPALFSRWKREHPELLMGTQKDAAKFPFRDLRHIWTPADFAHPDVRDLIVQIVRDVLNRYDVDGIDLDFLRARWYFQESRLGQPVTQQHIDLLTDMVGKIRKEVLDASKRKGKPILMSARTLSTAAFARQFGTDIERWMKLGYLDLVFTGGHFDNFTAMGRDLVRRGHALGLPVYLCLSGSDFMSRGRPHTDLSVGNSDAWRGAAANCWFVGADGLLTFNLFTDELGSRETGRQIWRDISDPEPLKSKDKFFCVENVGYIHDMCFLAGQSVLENPLPAKIERGSSATLTMLVGDNIPEMEQQIKSLNLRVGLPSSRDTDQVSVRLNGHHVKVAPEKPHWIAAEVPPQQIKRGNNSFGIQFAGGPSESVTVDGLELTVRYRS